MLNMNNYNYDAQAEWAIEDAKTFMREEMFDNIDNWDDVWNAIYENPFSPIFDPDIWLDGDWYTEEELEAWASVYDNRPDIQTHAYYCFGITSAFDLDKIDNKWKMTYIRDYALFYAEDELEAYWMEIRGNEIISSYRIYEGNDIDENDAKIVAEHIGYDIDKAADLVGLVKAMPRDMFALMSELVDRDALSGYDILDSADSDNIILIDRAA